MDNITLLGCGDIGPIHEPMDAYSVLVRSTLAAGDIRFAQCERVYSDRGSLQVHAGGGHSRVKPQLASIFSDCGFDVVSVASNHAMDWGEDALIDTITILQEKGIQTIGGGRNLNEARKPALIERKGVRVAVLGYCSVLREGYAAGKNKTGIAPLRVRTSYEPTEYQAGLPPKIITVPYEDDLEAMQEDIIAAKQLAQVVVVSLHWGIHFIPRMIADYQQIVAKAAFKSGADMIFGHHAHIPKAIDVLSGKVCFYSLSNFIMSKHEMTPAQASEFSKQYGVSMDPDYPRFPFGVDGKRSLIAKAVLTSEGVRKASFLPVLIDKQLRPEVLRHGDPRFNDAISYMDWASEGFNHKFTVEGDEVVITGT